MIQADLQLARPGFTLDVSLRLPSRGVSVLLGPSGCGKTSVLRALAGLERAQGKVALTGPDGAPQLWQDDGQGVFLPTHQVGRAHV